MYSLTRSQTPLSKSRCVFGWGATFRHFGSIRIRRDCSLRNRRPERCAVSVASKEDASQTDGSSKPYSNRLQNNPAYQRLKARQQQPQEKGAPTASTPAQEASVSVRSPDTDQAEASNRPTPGLGHRHKDRPVGRQPGNQEPTTSHSHHAPSPEPSEAPPMPQQPSLRSQPAPLSQQSPTQQSRAALLPLSALPHLSQPTPPTQAPVRHADFAGGQQQDQKSVAKVQFWLTFHAEFGQRLRVVGSHKNLGSWIMVDGPELKWTEGDRWHAAIDLPAGGVYEYKYVVLDSTGMHALTWQRGNNSVLAVKQDEGELEVFDNWEGQPGAAIMAGGKSSTRESKLLAWATDIEAQLGLQRQELRRSRMELASAQEDARRARQEARAVRMELAQSQSIRAQADKLIRELQSNNRLLKSELQATATSFRQALHVAQTMLDTAEEREDAMQEEAEEATEDTADPNLIPLAQDSPPSRPPSAQQIGQSATSTAMQAESQSYPVTMGDSSRSDAPAIEHQEEEEPSSAVSSTPEEQEEEEEDVQGEEAQIGAGGMQDSVAESSASSNARQQRTTSMASPVALRAGSKSQNTQAGRPSSSSRGFFDPLPTSAPPSVSAGAQAAPPGSSNRPQSVEDLPKHSTSSDKNTAPAPPKAPGSFPDSDQPSQPDQSSSPPEEAAGKQLETTRTAVPVEPKEFNAATASPTAMTNSRQKPAGEQLELAPNAVPTAVHDSNAAVSQVSTDVSNTSSGEQDPGAGLELEKGKNAVPLDVQGSRAAADAESDVENTSEDDSGDDASSAAGEELLQGAQAIPEAPSESNAAANSSKKAKKRKKKSLRR